MTVRMKKPAKKPIPKLSARDIQSPPKKGKLSLKTIKKAIAYAKYKRA